MIETLNCDLTKQRQREERIAHSGTDDDPPSPFRLPTSLELRWDKTDNRKMNSGLGIRRWQRDRWQIIEFGDWNVRVLKIGRNSNIGIRRLDCRAE